MKNIYAFLTLLFAVAATGSASATTWTIGVMNFEFTNVPTTVNVGDTITWTWISGTHTTTSTAVPAGAIDWNEDINTSSPSFFYVIAVPGSYAFVCAFHASMTGSFTAEVATAVTNPVSTSVDFSVYNTAGGIDMRYTLFENANTEIALTDLSGKVIYRQMTNAQAAGDHNLVVETASLSKGIYLATLRANNATATRKIFID